MNTTDILKIMVNDIHTTIIATVDVMGDPVTSVVDMMLEKNNKLYFITAKGKSLYKRMISKPNVSISCFKGEDTLSSISITLKGQVKDIGSEMLEEVFEKNSYMKSIYPTEISKKALTVLEFYQGSGEYFDLSKQPLERYSFDIGNISSNNAFAYFINDHCVECGDCLLSCPTQCIMIGSPYKIIQKHCLHCGNCFETCKHKSINASY